MITVTTSQDNYRRLRLRFRTTVRANPLSSLLLNRRRSFAVALGLACSAVALSFSPGWFLSHRLENSGETRHYQFASAIGETLLCDRISWAAHREHNLLFAGGGQSYYRSDCYEQVALARHNPSICWRVRPLIDFSPVSYGYSAWACRRRSLKRESPNGGPHDQDLVATLERFGYDIDKLHLTGVIEPAINVENVYRDLESNPAVIERAKYQLSTNVNSLQAGDTGYLAELVAIATTNSAWCNRVPAEQSIDSGFFREWCFRVVAYNAKDPQICQRMQPASMDPKVIYNIAHGMRREIAEQLSPRSGCEWEARNAATGRSAGRRGADVPGNMRQTLRLIGIVGATIPSARDWSESQRAQYYDRFLAEVGPDNHDAAHTAARQQLLKHLLSEP